MYIPGLSKLDIVWIEYPGLWNKFDLDCISDTRDQLYKFIGKFRYLGQKIYHKSSWLDKKLLHKCGLSRK